MSHNSTQELAELSSQVPTKAQPEEELKISLTRRKVRKGSIFEDDDYEEYKIQPKNIQNPSQTPTNICIKWLTYLSTAFECYYHPLFRINICQTASCFLYHWLNLFSALILSSFHLIFNPIWFVLLFAACIGIPFLWICLEISLLFARLDLSLAFHIIPDTNTILEERRHLIKMVVDTDGIPMCVCCNPDINRLYQRRSENRNGNIEHILTDDGFCVNVKNIWRRVKFLLTSCNMIYILLFQAIGKLMVVLLTIWIPVLIVAILIYVFLVWPNTISVMMVFEKIVMLLTVPLFLRLCNWTAMLNKKCVYYCYTYVYRGDVGGGGVALDDESALLEYNYLQKREINEDYDREIFEFNRKNKYIRTPSDMFSCQQQTVYRL